MLHWRISHMMRKIVSVILACLIALTGCASNNTDKPQDDSNPIIDYELLDAWDDGIPSFTGLDDSNLHQNIEDIVYASLVDEFNSEDYIIENVKAIYISKEYLEELSYNSKANIYSG